MSSKRVVGMVLAGLIGGIAVAVIGLIVGATYGSNYATGFQFNGLRGYEATGQIGAILGFVTGGALCSYLVARFTRRSS
jgi:hypothetical protein